jgi:hypothetical protein
MEILDQRRITDRGISYDVIITPDSDMTEPDGDCYTPEDRAAYGDTWSYVGVTVRPVVNGIDTATAGDSLWAVEHGTSPGWGRAHGMDYYLTVHPVPDMIREVRANLAKLRSELIAAWAALDLDD